VSDHDAGEIRMQERATGRETVLVRNLDTEDAHRVACQQWVSGGRRVLFHDMRNGEVVAATVDIHSLKERVLAKGRMVSWGQPHSDWAPIYGVHFQPGPYKNVELLNVETGEIRTLTAQQAVKLLESFHHDVAMHAQPKAGHWWDASDEPGTDCVDWAPMFDFFARHRLPEDREVREVDFRTFNPGASSKCHWLAIDAQLKPMILSRVQMRCDPGAARFEGTTENVARMSIDLKRVPTTRPIKAKIDGVELTLDGHEQAWLYREGEIWEQGSPPEAEWKRAARTGPFKQAFSNHMVFVYGTHGTDEENTVAFNKARFDAETWWYRGNGSVDVVADKGWLPRPDGGNVIVYGNADTNSVWSLLLSDSPIQVKRGELQIADQKFTGDDLAAMFIRPRAGDGGALVAAIAGTGPAGMRLTNRIPIFASGVAVPDWIVFGPDVLQKGLRAARGAGYFANDWSIGSDNVISQD
jgi:hypothetical protein